MNPENNPTEPEQNLDPHALPGRTNIITRIVKSVRSLFHGKKPRTLRSATPHPATAKVHRRTQPKRHAVSSPGAVHHVKHEKQVHHEPAKAPAPKPRPLPRASLRIVTPTKKPDEPAPVPVQAAPIQPEQQPERPQVTLAIDPHQQKTADVIEEGETWMSKVVGKRVDRVLHEDAFTVLRRFWGFGQSKPDPLLKPLNTLSDEEKKRLQKEAQELRAQSATDAFLGKVQLNQAPTQESQSAPSEAKADAPAIEEKSTETAPAKPEATPDQPKGRIVKPASPERAKAPAEAPSLVRKPAQQKNRGLAAFLASLNHMGLGKERTLFIQSLGTMLGAGLSLVDTLRTLQREARSKAMKKLLQRITENVESGRPLWRAMDEEYFFTPHAIALVRIGEESGDLAQNVVYLAEQEEKDQALRSKVKMAMMYPSIVMVLMFIIVIGLGMFVLPQLIGVLLALDVELPFTTRALIAFTNAFTSYGYIFIPASIAAFFFVVILSKYTSFKVVTQWIMFHMPGIGALAKEATIARFGVILGGLLRAGVPVVESISSLARVTPIVSYRKFYEKLLEHVSVGDSFAKSFTLIKHSEKRLPPSVQQLIMTGEQSGSLAEIMLKVADIYDKKASSTAEKLPVILEPILLLFIGALVALIAFSIIVPIYSIVGNVGQA